MLYNPNFNCTEFGTFRNMAGSGLIKKFGKGNTQKIKNVKDSYIQQAGESINNTMNKTNQKDKDIK